MDVGLYLNPQGAPDLSGTQLREHLLELARTARAVGFDHVSGGQHYLADYTQLQLFPFLSRVTAECPGLEIATAIALAPFHHPVDLAERFATLDALHEGPTVLGVGGGYRSAEFDAFGLDRRERAGRLNEGVQLTRRLLTEQSVSYDGEYYAVKDTTIPVRPEESQIWLAGNADAAVERAARLGDAWLVNPHATVAEIADQKASHYDPIRRRAGASTSVPVLREAFVADTYEGAVETAREHLQEKYRRYLAWGQDEAMEDSDDLHRTFEDLAADRFLLGTPEMVCGELERYERELDADLAILRCHWPGQSYDRTRECLELIGDEVIPNV